jgi:hypothetical protein
VNQLVVDVVQNVLKENGSRRRDLQRWYNVHGTLLAMQRLEACFKD